MFAAAICVSILLGVLVWALPGRLCDRRATHADVLAGPGIVLAVWIIAACVFAQPGLAQGFDLFRLLAINGAALWACGTVLLLRLRSGRRYRTLWTVAALLIAAIGLEVFVGNAPYFATHGYQPVDLRAYLQDAPADGEPIALNDAHSTLTFTGIHQPLYNVALDGVVYQYDGNYPQDQNPLFILWVSGTDEASTAPRQSWQWQAAPRAARSLVRTLDFSGAVDTLTLQAEGYSGEYRSYDLNYTVQAVLANVPRPMDFSLLRLAVVYLALLVLWGLRPGAAAWHEAYLTHRAKYRPAVLVLGCMLCLLAAAAPFTDARNSGVATSFYNVENWDGESRITFTQHISDWQNDSAAQYGALAHSLLNGRLDLQRDPPAAMAEMQNPYDTAARQNIIDGACQIAQHSADEIGKALGYDAVELSAHLNSAPDHEPVQGHIFLLAEYAKMQAGMACVDVDGHHFAGFKRPIDEWNCGHFAAPFSTEYSVRKYSDHQLAAWIRSNHAGVTVGSKEGLTLYQCSQMMRKIETDTRRWKDVAIAARAAGDDDLRREAQQHINTLSARYNLIAKQSGLSQRRDRMAVDGFRAIKVSA